MYIFSSVFAAKLRYYSEYSSPFKLKNVFIG